MLRLRALLAAAVLAVGLSACGGGGGSAESISKPTPSLTLSPASVAVTGDTSGTAPPAATVMVTVANPPSAGLQYQLTFNGYAIASAALSAGTQGSEQVIVSFPSPGYLGAGTYTGTVQVSACSDTACTKPIAGSPSTIAVTYTVTGAPAPTPTFNFADPISSFDAHTADAAPQIYHAQFNVQNVPAAGLYIKTVQPADGFITHLDANEGNVSDGSVNVDLQLTLQTPANLGSGFFASSVTFMVCYDTACTQQVTGSPVTRSIYYNIYLTQGKEYDLTTVASSDGVSDLVYDSVSNKLYVTGLSGYSSSNFNQAVTQVDPTTGSVSSQVSLNEALSAVAVSDDGTYLYAAASELPVIHRLRLPALQADLDIPLGSSGDPNLGQGDNIVSHMAVAPGAAQTLAVSLGHPHSIQTAGTEIFDGATARSQALAPLGYYASPDAIAWSGSSGLLYAYRYSSQLPFDMELDSITASGTGLSVQSSTDITGSADYVSQIVYDQGRLYDLVGFVRDANSMSILQQIVLPGNLGVPQNPPNEQIIAVVPDSAHGRFFYLVSNQRTSHLLLYNYDAATFKFLAVADLGSNSFDVAIKSRMIRWGSNGLALTRNGLQILSGSFYSPPASPH